MDDKSTENDSTVQSEKELEMELNQRIAGRDFRYHNRCITDRCSNRISDDMLVRVIFKIPAGTYTPGRDNWEVAGIKCGECNTTGNSGLIYDFSIAAVEGKYQNIVQGNTSNGESWAIKGIFLGEDSPTMKGNRF